MGGSCGYGELFEGLSLFFCLDSKHCTIDTTRSQPVRTYDMCHIKKCCIHADMRQKHVLLVVWGFALHINTSSPSHERCQTLYRYANTWMKHFYGICLLEFICSYLHAHELLVTFRKVMSWEKRACWCQQKVIIFWWMFENIFTDESSCGSPFLYST